MCLIFAATVDFRPLAPVCAALVCICVSILRPFFPITLPRLSFLPLSRRLFRHNWYPHAAVASCVTFLPAYISISHRSSSYFLPTINTLSRSVYILLAICEILNPDKISTGYLRIIFQREKKTCVYMCVWEEKRNVYILYLNLYLEIHTRATCPRIMSEMLTWYQVVLFVMSYFTLHLHTSRIHEAIYARFSIEAPRSIPIALFLPIHYICLHVDATSLSNMHVSPHSCILTNGECYKVRNSKFK